MSGKRVTRQAPGGESPPPPRQGTAGGRSNLSPRKTTEPQSVLEAADSGDYRAVLVSLRGLIARQIDDGCAPRDLVGLSRRLIDLAAELHAIDARDAMSDPGLSLVDGTFDPAAI